MTYNVFGGTLNLTQSTKLTGEEQNGKFCVEVDLLARDVVWQLESPHVSVKVCRCH